MLLLNFSISLSQTKIQKNYSKIIFTTRSFSHQKFAHLALCQILTVEKNVGTKRRKKWTNWFITTLPRYLTRELRYVDRSKVGLVGEGGGGYTAGMVLGLDLETSIDKQNPTTKCSVFISPTVDWKLSGF